MAGAEYGDGEDAEESAKVGSEEGGADGAGFEGTPILGQTSISPEDFKKVWWVLPQNRRVAKLLALIFLGVPGFSAIHHWMMPGGEAQTRFHPSPRLTACSSCRTGR